MESKALSDQLKKLNALLEETNAKGTPMRAAVSIGRQACDEFDEEEITGEPDTHIQDLSGVSDIDGLREVGPEDEQESDSKGATVIYRDDGKLGVVLNENIYDVTAELLDTSGLDDEDDLDGLDLDDSDEADDVQEDDDLTEDDDATPDADTGQLDQEPDDPADDRVEGDEDDD